MTRVHELDAHLVNKIAAGEVIERPASVIKELIENSLDAGSTRIEIAIEGGGTDRIQIADDGEGMSRDDLLLAVKRHTTSKIRTEDDLDRIATLGFRGEALASIVEVSRATITSRSADSDEATRVVIEGGVIGETRSEGRRPGTTIEIRDLFFNTPARRKFLKTERTESMHISRTVKRFALAYPNVHFKLTSGAKTVLESPPARDTREAIAHLYDAGLAKSLVEARSEGEWVRVHGFVAPADRTRTDRNEQFLFVNGRYVRDAALGYALKRAYEGLIDKDRHPIAFLFLSVDPDQVDVNVHPKKEEVRFADVRTVQGELKRAVSEALLSGGARRSIKDPASRSASDEDWTRSPKGRLQGKPSNVPRSFDLRTAMGDAQAASREASAETTESPVKGSSSASRSPEQTGVETHDRVIGQLHGTYLLVQTDEGLELIDQHVAHERVLYERFLKQLTTGEIRRQRLLIPMTLELSPDEAERLESYVEMLDRQIGIGLEPFGGGTFVVRDWPDLFSRDLTKDDVLSTMERLLATLEHEDELDPETLAKAMAADRACEAAVVQHTRLSEAEMQRLVTELRTLDNPYRCPHGRPIVLHYSLADLERAFGRRS